MGIENFIYRQKQKWKFHTARNDFERRVADINRNKLQVYLRKDHFKIKGLEISFSQKTHGFIIDRFDVFKHILNFPDSKVFIDGNNLYYNTQKLTLKISTAEEIFIIYEIFIKRCYEVITEFEFKVIDIGMNVGYASLFFAQNDLVREVYGFEPFAPTFNNALENFELNKDFSKKIIPKNIGLGFKECIKKASYKESLRGKNNIYSHKGNLEKVTIKRADDIIDSILRKDPDMRFLIKMDCEGSEYEIFNRYLEKRVPEQIFGMLIEWHFKDPQLIIDILKRDHFKIHKIHHDKLGFIIAFR